MIASDEDWPAVAGNLRKSWEWWALISRILGQEGADYRIPGNFYKAVVQVTLLLVAESWVVSPHIGRTLGRFHHRLDLWMVKMQLPRDSVGRWIYLPLEEAMKTVGMEEVETHVLLRHNKTTQYIATRSILELCLAAEIRPGERVSMRWW